MSKILLTGMTAPQASSKVNERSMSFAGLIYEALSGKHEVDWIDPQTSWDVSHLDQYDSIIVGIAPIMALGSTRAYGALSIISLMYASPKLRLFFDAPNPAQISHSLNAIIKDPKSMIKPFFDNRREYAEAQSQDVFTRMYNAVYWLTTARWPETFYPKLPWDQEDPTNKLPEKATEYITSVNLDSFVLNRRTPGLMPSTDKWVVDDDRSKWRDSVANTLFYPVISMKTNRFSSDAEIDTNMGTSIGVLLSPTKKGKTWWSYRYAQALSLNVPVITEWRDADILGESWTVLASQVEHLSDDRRIKLATDQLDAYKAAIDTEDQAIESLEIYLGLEGK